MYYSCTNFINTDMYTTAYICLIQHSVAHFSVTVRILPSIPSLSAKKWLVDTYKPLFLFRALNRALILL